MSVQEKRLEEKRVKYSGYSTEPDDYQSVDGAIAFASNATYEDGGIKGIPDSVRGRLVVAEGAQIYIHHTVNYYHYIIIYQCDGCVRLYVIDKENMDGYLNNTDAEHLYVDAIYHHHGEVGPGEDYDMPDNMTSEVVEHLYSCEGKFVDIQAVANTLVVSTDEDMYYLLCKPGGVASGTTPLTTLCKHPYIFLGNKVPSVEMQFALSESIMEKTYTNTGITKSVIKDGESISGDSEEMRGVTTIAGVSLRKDEDYFPDEAQLEAQHVYILWIANGSAIKSVTLHGTVIGSGPSGVQTIATSTGYYRFVAGYDYGSLYVTWESDSGNARGGMAFIGDSHRTLSTSETGSGSSLDAYFVDITEDNYTAVLGCINKFVADYGTDKNRFIHPFFVRYAVRMFDDSVCELSVPILMCPNSGYAPIVESNEYNDSDVSENLNLYAFVADLEYKLLAAIDNNWKDIIQSVDIYVSPPIYPYKDGAEYVADDNMFVEKKYAVIHNTGYDNVIYSDVAFLSYGMGKLKDATGKELSGEYTYNNLTEVARQMYGFCENGTTYVLQVSPKDEEKIDEEIKKEARFYLIKKINFEDLTASEDFRDIEMEDGVLEGLAGRESLDEDVVAWENFVGCGLHSYNSRLHTYGGQLLYRDVTNPLLQMQYLNSASKNFLFNDNDTVKDDFVLSGIAFTDAWVYINSEDGIKVEHTTFEEMGGVTAGFVWFFYPNNRAYKLVLRASNYGPYGFELSEHEFLNGAFFFARVKSGYFDETGEKPDDYDDYPQASIESKSVYVSEVGNPFTFRNSTAVTVGSGQVLALSSAAQAMSQGQFGQYPLYVFTDEGVWALEVASDGTYKTSQPITRDVCTNVDSITQLDSSVLFVTDRGIMELAGSKCLCISESIESEFGEFDLTELPYFCEIYVQYVQGIAPTDEDYAEALEDFKAEMQKWAKTRFFDFIRECRILYDYVHQRIIVYNAKSSIGYNYSLKDKEWGLMFTNLRYTLNSYPEAYALSKIDDADYGTWCNPQSDPPSSDEEHWELMDMSTYKGASDEGDEGDDDPDEETETMMFVTRPLKFDMPDIWKTVRTVVQRGYFQQSVKENHIVGTVLYGSPDLFNWYIVGQSLTKEKEGTEHLELTAGHVIDDELGSPYKYFRVMVVCRLRASESVYGLTALFERKDNNTLR